MKLYEDAHIHHVYVSYDNDYSDVVVRLLRPDQVHDTIRSWRPRYIAAYAGTNKGGRCRPGISYGFVAKNGVTLLEIRNDQLKAANTTPLSELLRQPAPCRKPGCLADKPR